MYTHFVRNTLPTTYRCRILLNFACKIYFRFNYVPTFLTNGVISVIKTAYIFETKSNCFQYGEVVLNSAIVINKQGEEKLTCTLCKVLFFI